MFTLRPLPLSLPVPQQRYHSVIFVSWLKAHQTHIANAGLVMLITIAQRKKETHSMIGGDHFPGA